MNNICFLLQYKFISCKLQFIFLFRRLKLTAIDFKIFNFIHLTCNLPARLRHAGNL
jgi:hypothetical protein